MLYELAHLCLIKIKKKTSDFLGGTGDKNPLANAGDRGSILGVGRFHVL